MMENQLKVAYIYNFTKFVDWPENRFDSPNSSIKICVIGQNPFGSLVDELSSKTAKQRPITIQISNTSDEFTSCHIIYFNQFNYVQHQEAIQSLRSVAVLTISDVPGFIEIGGIIEFIVDEGKIHLAINQEAAQRAGLRISASLMEVAKRVIGVTRKDDFE